MPIYHDAAADGAADDDDDDDCDVDNGDDGDDGDNTHVSYAVLPLKSLKVATPETNVVSFDGSPPSFSSTKSLVLKPATRPIS